MVPSIFFPITLSSRYTKKELVSCKSTRVKALGEETRQETTFSTANFLPTRSTVPQRLLPENNMQGHVRQARIIVISLAHLDEKELDLLPRPATAPSQGTEGDGLHAVQQNGAPVQA